MADQRRSDFYAVFTMSLCALGLKQLSISLLQRVPANKKPPCIRNGSHFSYKTMDKTIGYCSKTIGCTRKSGILFVGTHCISNHTALILSVHALRSYLKLICEYELHNLSNKKVSGVKDHGKNYIKVRPPLDLHLLLNCLLLVSHRGCSDCAFSE